MDLTTKSRQLFIDPIGLHMSLVELHLIVSWPSPVKHDWNKACCMSELGTEKTGLVLSCRYRSLGVALLESGGASREEKQFRKQTKAIQQKFDRLRLRNDMRSNVNRNLPQNVPY